MKRKEIQYESESESCRASSEDEVDDESELELKNWTATSVDEFNAVERVREYKFVAPPDWTCTICNETIRHCSVIQCQQGHLACNTCTTKGMTCKVCSNSVSRIKNLAVEKMMNITVATCKFATLGCTEVIKFRHLDSSEHEKTCLFAPMVCPMPDCHQAGVTKLFSQHLLNNHNISFMLDLEKQYFHSEWRSEQFELNASTNLVLLREIGEDIRSTSPEFHLLHHEITLSSDQVYITSLLKSTRRGQYDLEVKFDNDVTFSLKGNFGRREGEPQQKLLIPKELGGQRKYSIRTSGRK